MVVAIPVVDNDVRSNEIAPGLSVIGHICIYDIARRQGEWMETRDLAPNMGELLPALVARGVSALITRQIHPMALKVLVGKGLHVYRAVGKVVDENLKMFSEDALSYFDMDTALTFAKVCGGECDSCSTDCEPS